MTLVTRSVELMVGRDPDKAIEKLASLRELQRDALAEMRSLLFELRPGSLAEDGLVRALRTHAAAVQGRLGLPIVLAADEIERLPIEIEEALYRIAQEALHNVVKHAGAHQVRITLARDGDRVRLAIEDDGSGFDTKTTTAGSLGLASMRARAEQAGGRFEVTSRRGRGTRVAVSVPAPHPADGAESGRPPDSVSPAAAVVAGRSLSSAASLSPADVVPGEATGLAAR